MEAPALFQRTRRPILRHLQQLWITITRSPLAALASISDVDREEGHSIVLEEVHSDGLILEGSRVSEEEQ